MSKPETTPPSGYHTPHWVRTRYSISNSTLWKWVADGHLKPPVKLGKRAVRFRAEDLQRFEEDRADLGARK